MRTVQLTTKTSEEIAAAFTAVCKDIKPVEPPPKLTQADRLAPYRKQILKQRRRGLSWEQIATAMADPRIGEKVNARLLRRLFGTAVRPPSTDAAVAKPTPVPPPAVPPPRPVRQHLILDPLTNLPIPQPAPKTR